MLSSSAVLSNPVSWDFVGFEHLLPELLVTSILDCIHFKSVRVCIHIMEFCEQVTHWVNGGNDETNDANNYFLIWNLVS